MEFAPKKPVPVFPLPRAVLFPHTILPLHVFELRYRTMVREALSGERMLAIATLKPGFEQDYHGSPPFYPIGCLARFEDVEWLPNDSYNLKVLGTHRVRFERIVKEFPYRAAQVEILREAPYTEDDPLTEIEKRALTDVFGRWIAAVAEKLGQGPPGTSFDGLRYEVLVNGACMLLTRDPDVQRGLLEMDSVIDRGKRARELLELELERGVEVPRQARPDETEN